MRALTVATMFGAIAATGAATAAAQDTRADVIRQQQAERQQELHPPEGTAFERVIDRLERWGYITGTPRGVYPWFGSVYPGGGFAAGAGARKPFGDDGAITVLGARSVSSFSRAQADLSLPTFADGRGRVTVSGRYIDAPGVKFYGTGNESGKDNRTTFGYAPASAGGRVDFDLSRRFSIGGGVGFLQADTSGGRTAPSIEQHFTPADVPGLERGQFRFVTSTARAVYDWRKALGYSGSGGMYRAQFDDFRDRGSGRYSFRSLEAEALQLLPILRANWVVALRGLATVTDASAGSDVPYFLMPSIGGSTLRGYQDFRFRDRNRLVMNAELRWTPARFMDMAVFYDTGKVAARREDLDFDGLQNSYGLGMRLIGPKGYALSLEAAHSREHRPRLLLSVGGAF